MRERLKEGSQEFPDGVLAILLESNGQAAMTVGLTSLLRSVLSLAGRARRFHSEKKAAKFYCAPEVLAGKDGKA